MAGAIGDRRDAERAGAGVAGVSGGVREGRWDHADDPTGTEVADEKGGRVEGIAGSTVVPTRTLAEHVTPRCAECLFRPGEYTCFDCSKRICGVCVHEFTSPTITTKRVCGDCWQGLMEGV